MKNTEIMFIKNKSNLYLILSAFFLASCTAPRIAGTWQITNYETNTGDGQEIKLANIGSLQFKKNNTGKKQINYSVLQNKVEDNNPFKWVGGAESITITGKGTELNKTWIIVEDGKKYQKWKSTDGGSTVQILELKKQ